MTARISTISELMPEPTEAAEPNLRTQFLGAYGPKAYIALAALGSLFLLPFAVHNVAHGRFVAGVASAAVAFCLLVNAWTGASGKPLIPTGVTFLPVLAALGFSMLEQGLVGILWCYAAILLFHFTLPRRLANAFNAIIVLLAVPMAYLHLGSQVTVRVAVTMALTVLFTNVFSSVAEARQRKEVEQRQRLDLILRGTNAGTLEWEPDGKLRFSRRLRQMLGRGTYEDASQWDFFSFVHPDDRERVQAQLHAQFGVVARRHAVLHQPPDEYRLQRDDGEVLWVHTEGILVTDGRGRARRCILSFMDISDRFAAQQALIASHQQVQEQAALLEEQNAQLREAVRVREEVERIARHDLKAPLASIASIPRLLREPRTQDEREELLAMIERAALRVLAMVNLSLDLHRMEQGTYRLRPRPVDLGAIARTVALELRAHADSKHVRLALEAPPEPVFAQAEELLCYSIVANLVKNALEASPEDGTVLLRLACQDDCGSAVLAIGNAGAVPAAVRERFFDKYTTAGKPGGTGLGAYSARLMARMQGGELCMRTGEGHTTLTLALPLAHEGAAAESLPPDDAEPETSPPQPARASTVLVVDDDPYNVLVLRSMLAQPGIRLLEAVNGRAAIECVAKERPDVIFLDLQMPIMGGVETVARIRELQRTRGQPPSTIIAFSARDDEESRRECSRAGFDHYVVKPATREELLALLATPPRVPVGANALLPEFVASRRGLLDELQVAASQKRRDEVRRLAHRLAGSLKLYGFVESGSACSELESLAPQAPAAALRELCSNAARRFEDEQSRLLVAS